MDYLVVLLTTALLALAPRIWKGFVATVWRPYSVTRNLRRQGVGGPPYRFMKGAMEEVKRMRAAAEEEIMDTTSHDISPRVLPHYLKWFSMYGDTFLYWFETTPHISVTDIEIVKQMLISKFAFFSKDLQMKPVFFALMGRGLPFTDGPVWARHRTIVSPAFSMDKLKAMTKAMAACTMTMMDSWQDQVVKGENRSAVVDVDAELKDLTSRIIAKTAFGDDYVEGEQIFHGQSELIKLAQQSFFTTDFPLSQYIPTKSNRRRWDVDKQVRIKIASIIQRRLDNKSEDYGKDLLGLMMESNRSNSDNMKLDMEEIMDECKTFFFAGHETTALLLTWTIYVLSIYPDWQERLRDEVLKESGTKIPDAEVLNKFKLMTMVFYEVLRLYPPVINIIRRTKTKVKVGNIMVPEDTLITAPVPVIHRNKELWGDDAGDFNPLRFKNGVSKATKHPNAFLSFLIGPRVCVGQNFSLMEAKVALVIILQKFSFSLSPDYKHAPFHGLTLVPQFGVPVILRALQL